MYLIHVFSQWRPFMTLIICLIIHLYTCSLMFRGYLMLPSIRWRHSAVHVRLICTATDPLRALSLCVDDVCRWFLQNRLLPNPSKTEAVLFGTRIQRNKVPTLGGNDVAGTLVPFRATVKLLGVTLDSVLSMDRHVTEVVHSCNYYIRALRHIRPLLTPDVAKILAHSIVTSRLDYANALLSGMTSGNLDRLQVAQNSLAKVVCQTWHSASATELLRQLHWLPIRQRTAYKLAVITYHARSTGW